MTVNHKAIGSNPIGVSYFANHKYYFKNTFDGYLGTKVWTFKTTIILGSYILLALDPKVSINENILIFITKRIETSQQLQEKKSIEISLVVVSESDLGI